MTGGYFDSGWQGDGETCGVCGRVMTDGPCACAAKPGRIELHIPPKIPQCKVCGKVRIGKDWVKDDDTQPDLVVWACPGCADNQRRATIRHEKKWKRELRRDARTPHPVKEMTDEDWDALKS